MARISREDVQRTAALAHLYLSDDETERMTLDLARILDHAAQLQELDTSGIEPTAHAIPLATPTRPDTATAGIDPELAMQNAPQREGTAFVVPRVIEGEAG